VDDVDLEDGWMRILGKGGKERVVQTCDPAITTALVTYFAARDEGDAARGVLLSEPPRDAG
jgi:site-specific recombinase XerC